MDQTHCHRYRLIDAWTVWVIAALFFSIEFFQRVSPAVMANPIMHSLHINATTLGIVNSLYLYAYAIAQIPVGLILDKFGIRKPLSIACILISFGSLLFALGQVLAALAVARILIGFGSAFAFIGTLKLISNWFAERHYPFMVGLTNTLGVLGAIAGEGPFSTMVNHLGWQHSLSIVAIIGLAVALLIWLFVKDQPDFNPDCCSELIKHQKEPPMPQVILDIIQNKQSWLTAAYAGLMVAPIIAFGELWAVPFFEKVYGLSKIDAATVNTAIFVGIGLGGPLNGLLAGYLPRRKLVMWLGNICALAALTTIVFSHLHTTWDLAALMFAFGFFTSSMLLCFTLNKERHPASHNATIIALTNMVIMLSGAIYQPLIGFLLDHLISGYAHQYTSHDYRMSLLILPCTLVVNLIILVFVREQYQMTS